jgi:hypothetical protein
MSGSIGVIMKIKLFLVITILLLLSFGCSTIKVNYDYDANADFSSLKRYDWLESSLVIQEEALLEKRIKNAITMNLQSKGFVHSTEEPDFLIALQGVREFKRDVVEFDHTTHGRYMSYDGYWQNHRVEVFEYEEGTVIVDFISIATKELIWRGTGTGVIEPHLSPQARDKRINNAIFDLLENFPPIEPANK